MTSKAYGALFLSPPILEEQKKGDRYLHTMVTDGSSRLRPGMELVLTRWIALSGTAKLAVEKEEELSLIHIYDLHAGQFSVQHH